MPIPEYNHQAEIREAKQQVEFWEERLDELTSGRELCNSWWDPHGGCFDIYCGCGERIGEVREEKDVPFKDTDQGKCGECRKSPEQRETERKRRESKIEQEERETLAKLKQKYEE